MKPTAQQIQNLKNYLRGVFKFRETYEEVFDHILTAIEHRKPEGRFEDAVNQVIREDFGGANKLPDLEATALVTVRKEGVARYLRYFTGQFYGSGLMLPILAGTTCFIWLKLMPGVFPIALSTVVLLFLVPRAISIYRYFKVGYIFKDRKPSIKDVIYNRISVLPVRLYLCFCFFSLGFYSSPFEVWSHIDKNLLCLIFTLGVCYIQAYTKLVNEEFNLKAFNQL